jgi:queuosine precursor transporter
MLSTAPDITSIQAKKRGRLLLILTGIFLTNALIAEIIGVKLFSAELIFGLPPAQIPVFPGFALSFTYTAGVVIWPVVFITSDIINEYFGPAGVKRISVLTAIFIAYAFIIIYLVTTLPPAAFWIEINQTPDVGKDFNINTAFSIGSLTAFLIGQLLDAYVFHYIRSITGSRKIWLRATGSTLVSQLVDSFIVLYIAFYVFGPWTISDVVKVGINNYLYKFVVAIVLTPVLYLAHYWIDHYLGRKRQTMSE